MPAFYRPTYTQRDIQAGTSGIDTLVKNLLSINERRRGRESEEERLNFQKQQEARIAEIAQSAEARAAEKFEFDKEGILTDRERQKQLHEAALKTQELDFKKAELAQAKELAQLELAAAAGKPTPKRPTKEATAAEGIPTTGPFAEFENIIPPDELAALRGQTEAVPLDERSIDVGDTGISLPAFSREESLKRMAEEVGLSPSVVSAGIRASSTARLRRDPIADAVAKKQALIDAGLTQAPVTLKGAIGDQGELVTQAAAAAGASFTADKRDNFYRELQRRMETGDPQGINEYIVTNALNSENVDARNDVRARMETLNIMNDVRGILKDMKGRGVPTNIISGNAEDAVRILGKSTNPEYAALSNELKSALFAYRKAMTGVQFSVKESKDYEKMFPNYKNEFPLNMALIDGIRRGFEIRNDTYWTVKLGGEAPARAVGVLSDMPSESPGASGIKILSITPVGQ